MYSQSPWRLSNRSRLLLSALVCAGSVFVSTGASAEIVEYKGKKLDIATPGETIANQIVVVAETRAAKTALVGLAKSMGARVARDISVAGMQAWALPSDAVAKRTIDEINKMKGFHAYANPKMSIAPPPEVLPQLRAILAKKQGRQAEVPDAKSLATKAAPSGDVQAQWSTNDVSVTNQWSLTRISEPLLPTPSAGTHHIAIIDTGVDYRHPDLAGKVVSVWDYVDNDADAMDVQGHGTHCSGIAAATAGNTVGIRGVSPNSKIYAYRVLDETGSGTFTDIMAAIYAAADNVNVQVLSLSLSGYVTDGGAEYNDMKAAVDYAVATKGKVLVAAASNEYNDVLYYYQWAGYNYRPVPAWVPNSFTVASTTETDTRSYFSNYNANVASPDATTTYNWNFVDIAAPGSRILSTTMNDGYEMWSGTSMATPLVAGAVARFWDRYSGFTAAQVRSQFVGTGQQLCRANGFPVCVKRLDLYRAFGGTYTGGFIGRVLDGEAGQPVEGVTVEAMAGATVAASAVTNRAGFYVLPSVASYPSGYVLRLSKTGWVTRSTPGVGDRTAGALKTVGDQPILPSRPVSGTDENLRIVAWWPQTEPGYDIYTAGWNYGGYADYFPYTHYHAAGMEANAFLRAPDGTVYYWNTIGSLSVAPYTRFMHDSYNSTPLESFVIRDKAAGTYNLWMSVDPYDFTWGAIKYGLGTVANPTVPSYPMVEVYKGNAFLKRVNSASATQVSTGTKYWNVLNLTDAVDPVTVINQVTDTTP